MTSLNLYPTPAPGAGSLLVGEIRVKPEAKSCTKGAKMDKNGVNVPCRY